MAFSKAEQTAAITRSIQTGARAPLASFNSRKYIQHNVNIGTGLRPILEFMDGLPPGRTRADVLRAFEDGDYSVVHVDYELGDWGNVVAFDVHRWEDDHIVEHWDNVSPMPADLNPSGRSPIDGATKLEEVERTEEHRDLIRRFANEVLLTGVLEADASFFRDGLLLQHSASFGDGVGAFRERMETWRNQASLRYEKVHKILGQGNMFLVMSEGVRDGRPVAFYDLYRLSKGFIVEHWDVVEEIPRPHLHKHQNGNF